MSTLHHLEAVKSYLSDPANWRKGAPDATRPMSKTLDELTSPHFHAHYLCYAAAEQNPFFTKRELLGSWQDLPVIRHSDIIAVLDHAIELAKQNR